MDLKRSLIIAGIGAGFLVSLSIGSLLGPHQVVNAEKEYPAQAKQLGEWIDDLSAKYDQADKLTKELEKQLADAMKTRDTAAEAARGYRYSLCKQFSLVRAAGHTGQFLPAPDGSCVSFQ